MAGHQVQDTPRRLARKDVGPGKAEGNMGWQKVVWNIWNIERDLLVGQIKCTTPPKTNPKKSKDQTLPIGSRESFTWSILKTILCLVLDFQGNILHLEKEPFCQGDSEHHCHHFCCPCYVVFRGCSSISQPNCCQVAPCVTSQFMGIRKSRF